MEPTADERTRQVGAEGIALVAFDSCGSALNELRRNALPHVGPYGLNDPGGPAVDTREGGGRAGAPGPAVPPAAGAAEGDSSAPGKAADQQQEEPGHSTTNTHEAGVDEPDLVKTDGRRIITIADGTFRVIDVASRSVKATLQIPGGSATQLLLHGDRALVMTAAQHPEPQGRKPTPLPNGNGLTSQLVLVDLAEGAKVIGSLSVDGGYIDARQIGSVARVVVRSGPSLKFVYPDRMAPDAAQRQNREIVERSSISDWLPRFELSRNGSRSSGQLVDCAAVSHPESYSGTAMLTVLTVDLTRELGVGDPVSIVADGDTVYATGTSLYVADDHMPHATAEFAPDRAVPTAQRTEVYQFDISGAGKPTYVASGGMDGVLLNQYSLSEHAGHLRIATTVGEVLAGQGKSESAVTVLARKGDALVQVGRVGGLGVGERIYAVRFFGNVGYVVTFRQTDPLYTVDLSNPAQPRVVGELKITGYSAYLHAAGEGRLIGVGQEATEQGRQTGTQVSLFDTGNVAAARRVAQHHLPGSSSEVEFDPHAFLYWPDKGLLVVPVSSPVAFRDNDMQTPGALVLRLSGDSFTELGVISHPVDPYRYPDGSVRRALVIGEELWTVSAAGAMATDLSRLGQLAWIPFA